MFGNRFVIITTVLQGLILIALLFAGYASSTDIVIVYALETILVGVFHAVKLLLLPRPSRAEGTGNFPSGIGLVLFFMVHYGIFVMVQTTFFFNFLSQGDDRIKGGFGWDNFATVLQFPGVQAAGIIFTSVQLIKFFTKFLPHRHKLDVEPQTYMFVPYLRIIIQQFTAILPGFFIIFFSGNIAVALVLILFRTLVDALIISLKGDERFLDRFAGYMHANAKTASPQYTPETIKGFLKLVIRDY